MSDYVPSTQAMTPEQRAIAWLSEHLGGWPVGPPDRLHIAGRKAREALEHAFADAIAAGHDEAKNDPAPIAQARREGVLIGVRAGIEAARSVCDDHLDRYAIDELNAQAIAERACRG